MRRALRVAGIAVLSTALHAQAPDSGRLLRTPLPPLPPGTAVAGAFAGVSHGAWIVAGGADFPTAPPWQGGTKTWHDRVLLRAPDATRFTVAPLRLATPCAYGVTVADGPRVLCVGGGDSERHATACFALTFDPAQRAITSTPLPALPEPLAFACGAIVGRTLFVAGGRTTPTAERPTANAWSLALDVAAATWTAIPPLPGRPRMLAIAGAQDGAFFVVGGTDLERDADGAEHRVPLTDGYRFDPGRGWRPIRALPEPRLAAPSPAWALGQAHLVILGGDDGALTGRDLRDAHPGFRADALCYHTVTDTWRRLDVAGSDATPWPVTTPGFVVDGHYAIVSGEARPGVRSAAGATFAWQPAPAAFGALDYGVLALYLVGLVVIGLRFTRRDSDTATFFLGNRRVPWWAAGLSIFGTQLSAITFMAMPALVFRTDWVYLLGNLMIAAAAPLVVFGYLPHFVRTPVTTAYEVLERRFSLSVRLAASAAFLAFQLGRMGILLCLPAMALATVTGLDVRVSILVMGGLATLYTVMGGIEAVIWTDVLQVVVLVGGAIACVAVALGSDTATFADAIAYDKLRLVADGFSPATTALWVVLLGRFVESCVPYTSDQTVVQRYLATRDAKTAARSIWTNAVLSVPATLLFFTLGTALWLHYRVHPERLDAAGGHDELLPWFVVHELPSGLAGLVIAGLFAASMSSLDSSMNSMATALTTDWVQRLRRSALPEPRALRLARTLTLALGIVGTVTALVLASHETTSVWDRYTRIIGLFGGGLAGLFALAVFTRHVSGRSALIGFIGSAPVLHVVAPHVHFFLYATVGFTASIGLALLAERIAPARRVATG